MESRLPVRGRDSWLPGYRFPVSFSLAQYPTGSLGQVSGYCDGRLLAVLASANAPVQPQYVSVGQSTLLHDNEIRRHHTIRFTLSLPSFIIDV
jgi:hypothetical protein